MSSLAEKSNFWCKIHLSIPGENQHLRKCMLRLVKEFINHCESIFVVTLAEMPLRQKDKS